MGRLLTAVLAALPELVRTYAAGGFAGVILAILTVALMAAVLRIAPVLQIAINYAVLCVVIAVTAFVITVIGLIAVHLLRLAYRSWREGS